MTVDKFYKHPSSPHQACSIEVELAWKMDILSANSISLDCNRRKKNKNSSGNQQQAICALLTNLATLQAATLVTQAARRRPTFTSQTR